MNWDWNAIYLTCFGVGLVLTLVASLAEGCTCMWDTIALAGMPAESMACRR